MKIKWSKGLSDGDYASSSEGQTLALSAFHLSSLPTAVARKELIKQMWDSGANVIVSLDPYFTLAMEILWLKYFLGFN